MLEIRDKELFFELRALETKAQGRITIQELFVIKEKDGIKYAIGELSGRVFRMKENDFGNNFILYEPKNNVSKPVEATKTESGANSTNSTENKENSTKNESDEHKELTPELAYNLKQEGKTATEIGKLFDKTPIAVGKLIKKFEKTLSKI